MHEWRSFTLILCYVDDGEREAVSEALREAMLKLHVF
jgi:hypothetical protein